MLSLVSAGRAGRAIPFVDQAAQHAALRPELDRTIAEVMTSGEFVLGRPVARFEERSLTWALYMLPVLGAHAARCENEPDRALVAQRSTTRRGTSLRPSWA